jgi:hypothetical protein
LRRARAARLPIREWWRIPLLVALKDLAQIAGTLVGISDGMRATFRPRG